MDDEQKSQIGELLQEAMELAVRKHDIDGAVEKLTQVLEIDPSNDDALLNLGNCQMMRGDLTGALDYYDRAAAVAPENYGIDWNRAILQLRLDRVDNAMTAINRFLERAGSGIDQQADQIIPKARAFKMALEVLLAKRDTEAEIERNPPTVTDSAEAELAYMRASQASEMEPAVADLMRAVERDPGHALAHNMLGGLLMIQQRVPEAVREFTLAMALDEANPAPRANRAGCFMMISPNIDGITIFHELALVDMSAAVQANPRDANMRVNRTKIYRLFKDYEAARNDLEVALEVEPRHVEALFMRGLVRNATNDFDGAVADYTAALNADPNRDDILPGRALARMATNDRTGAAEDMGRYIERGCKGEMSRPQAESFLRAMQGGQRRPSPFA